MKATKWCLIICMLNRLSCHVVGMCRTWVGRNETLCRLLLGEEGDCCLRIQDEFKQDWGGGGGVKVTWHRSVWGVVLCLSSLSWRDILFLWGDRWRTSASRGVCVQCFSCHLCCQSFCFQREVDVLRKAVCEGGGAASCLGAFLNLPHLALNASLCLLSHCCCCLSLMDLNTKLNTKLNLTLRTFRQSFEVLKNKMFS